MFKRVIILLTIAGVSVGLILTNTIGMQHVKKDTLDQRNSNYQKDLTLSDTSRKLFEKIEQDKQKAKENRKFSSDPSGKTPGFISFMLSFQPVDNLERFQLDLALWEKEKKTKLQHEELKKRLDNLKSEAIVPGQVYPGGEYVRRINNMLDTAELLSELGELDKANEMANSALSLTAVDVSEPSNAESALIKLALRPDVLWRMAQISANDELFEKALDSLNSLLKLVGEKIPSMSNKVTEDLADRHLQLANSNNDRIQHLNSAKYYLEPLAKKMTLSPNGWMTYTQVLYGLSEYKKANEALLHAVDSQSPDQKLVKKLPYYEIVCLDVLTKLDTTEKFVDEFGPFSAPILAECKKIYLADAWQLLYLKPIDFSGSCKKAASAMLMENVIVYEDTEDPVLGGKTDVFQHELIHQSVKEGVYLNSEGKWYPAFRDVPTAALDTYMRQISRSLDLGKPLPDCLRWYIDFGKRAAQQADPQHNDKYIENMLQYHKWIKEETNSSYENAAILSGMLLELLGHPDSMEMESYISHLKVMNHKEALQKAKLKVKLEW